MSREVTVAVTLKADRGLRGLIADIKAARRRADSSDPGDRAEIVRYESLCASLEALAGAALARDPAVGQVLDGALPGSQETFRLDDADHVTVTLTLPLEPGARPTPTTAVAAPPAARAWPVRADLAGRRLIEQRFREQLAAAVREPGQDRAAALSPSGIHNRVLTEVLREYVELGEHGPVRVPVVYRDGSRSLAPFPLRCLPLTDTAMSDPGLVLRLALLSIRHSEMDPVVDGAWLRNAEVSRPRPAGQTDDFVHATSARQLRELTRHGTLRVRLFIFQTGLETAVVGFFRAVVEHLLVHPGTLEVVPMFYAPRKQGAEARASVEEQFAGFERGAGWATREA
jgi:hypothetical protein